MSTILVVDDDVGLQETLRTLLEYEGYHVVTAEDGQVALAQVAVLRPALVLLDLMMPRMDGPAFVAALEHNGWRDTMKIMVVSADRYTLRIAERLHVDGVITKPFEVQTFITEVQRLVGNAA
jgi:CheY-like chemotaxis protein